MRLFLGSLVTTTRSINRLVALLVSSLGLELFTLTLPLEGRGETGIVN